jgi:hypothetical protein
MTKLISGAAAAAVIFSGTVSAFAQSANFEAKSMPITLHQAQVTGLADIREEAAKPRLVFGGMPASPHQVAALSPRGGSEVKVVLTSEAKR